MGKRPRCIRVNNKEDFRTVLEELCKIKDDSATIPRPTSRGADGKWKTSGLILADGYSIAWRVLDAQFWGVPQRRRRIFLVADFGGGSAGEVLFEREGLSRNFAESQRAWKRTAPCTSDCSNRPRQDNGRRVDGIGRSFTEIISIENHPNDSRVSLEENGIVQTLTGRMGTGGGNVPLILVKEVVGVDTYNKTTTGDKTKTLLAGHQDCDGVPCVAINVCQDPVPNENITPCLSTGNSKSGQANLAVCFNIDAMASNAMKSTNPQSGIRETDVHRCLDTAVGNGSSCKQGGTVICYAIDRAAFNQGQNAQYDIGIDDKGKAQTLVAKGPGAVCYGLVIQSSAGIGSSGENVSPALVIGDNPGWQNGILEFIRKYGKWIVRRVTPTECARLQGMPDWWCGDIPHSDSAEYKMWGNGMALPCVMYVMEGIAKQLKKQLLEEIGGNK